MQRRAGGRLSLVVLIAVALTIVLTSAGCSEISLDRIRMPWEKPFVQSDLTPAPTLPPVLTRALQPGTLSPEIDRLAYDVLDNIRRHGWNPAAKTHGQVTGGLYINWQMNDPHQTNALRGKRNKATASKHDTQVDLYYLNALAQYSVLHPTDHHFDSELQKMLGLVKKEFGNYNLPKGWIYFFLLRDGLLLHDNDLLNAAHTAAEHYYHVWYDPAVRLIYNRNAEPGDANVEHTLNCAAALIDAGRRWNQPAWLRVGKMVIHNTIALTYNRRYHLFANNFVVGSTGHAEILNYQAKPSTQGNGTLALINAYTLTHDQYYLDLAGQVLESLFTGPLWDQRFKGFFFAFNLANGKLNNTYKETRSQTLSLIALSHYNRVMKALKRPLLLSDRQESVIKLLRTRFYQATYHGFFYRLTPAYDIYVSQPGEGIGVENFFTTEAMGTALDALQQTEFM